MPPETGSGGAARACLRETRPRASSSLTAEGHAHALRLCKEWDVNLDGTISRKELARALKQIFADCSEDDVESVMQAVDVNKDGVLQYNEVLAWLRLPPYEKRCFEDNLRSYIQGAVRVPSPARPVAGALAPEACGAKLWDERLLQSFTHPLLGRFCPLAELVDSARTPPDAVRVRLIKRGVRASAGEAACTVLPRRGPAGERILDASVRAPDYAGDGVQRLLTTLRHYAEVHVCILEAFCDTIEATEKPGKPVHRLRFEPPPVLGRDLREAPPVPQALWSATALALARLSPARQRKLAHANVDLCVGSAGAAAEYASVLDAKVAVASSAVGSASVSEEALPQRKGGFSWVRLDNDPEARLCRLQAFSLTQRAAYAGGYEVAAGPGRPRKAVALTQVDRMVQGTSVRLAAAQLGNAPQPPPPPGAGRRTELRTPLDLGLSERSTAMEVAQALAAKGKKVAAVNAASAYSPGGGCSSGGRHALEEAWCTCSTLYRSLTAAKAAELAGPGQGGPFPPQHVPTLGCVVSPEVELFREGTERGYGFLAEPVRLCGVLSVAMFNRNPCVSDSPLDCPEDPATYVAQIQAKLEAVVLAASELGADVLVVPDVGCGVFQNDALVVGGSLGSVLRKCSGLVREVVVLGGTHAGFAEACKRTFSGEDPRETCLAGGNCGQLADPLHAARLLHRGQREEVEAALVTLAAHPEEIRKPECRYGALCHIKDQKHLARFLHPPPSETIPWSKCLDEEPLNPMPMEFVEPWNPAPMEYVPPKEPQPPMMAKAEKAPAAAAHRPPSPAARRSPSPLARAGAARLAAPAPAPAPRQPSPAAPPRQPSPAAPPRQPAPAADARPPPSSSSPAGASSLLPAACSPVAAASSSKTVCKYGEACYSKNPRHFKDYSHPWLEGAESSAKAKEQEDVAKIHDLLTLGKAGNWVEVKAMLRERPDFINGRPECRSFGLVHHAAWQIRMDEMEVLVLDFGADLGARTKEGKTAEGVLEESVQLGGLSPAESARAVALQKWLRRRIGWRSESSPTSASPTGCPASAGPAVGPAVAGAMAEAFVGATAAGPTPGPKEPEVKRGGVVMSVCSCLNMKLEGDYLELAKAHNGFTSYWKAAQAGGVLGAAAGHYLYYNFRTGLGWVIDTDLSDSNEPLAYLGASQCGADPSAKAYGEAWKVHCINKIAGGYYSRDSVMRIKRR